MGNAALVIVDDNKELLERFSTAAAEFGFECAVFTDGEAALDYLTFHQGDIALALIDLDMPGANGFEVITRALSIRDLRLIAMSGVMDEHYLQVAKHLGAAEAVRKRDDPGWPREILCNRLAQLQREL